MPEQCDVEGCHNDAAVELLEGVKQRYQNATVGDVRCIDCFAFDTGLSNRGN